MMGIIVNEFNSIINKNQSNISSLEENITDIETNYSELSKNVNSSDLKFLTRTLEKELQNFDNIKLKVESYQNVLQKMVASYIAEEEELANNINQIIP